MKINPYDLARADEPEETRTFTEPGSDNSLTLTLRKFADLTREYLIVDRRAEHEARYITGQEVRGDDGKTHTVVQTMKAVRGRIPVPSPTFCHYGAMIEVMQVPQGDDEPYTFEELCALGVAMPQSMQRVVDWVIDLRRADPSPNDSGAGGDP